MKPKHSNPLFARLLRGVSLTSMIVISGAASAAEIVKENNTDALNLTTSWVGGVAPTSADVAVWDATVAGANSVALGADTSLLGVKITSPGGLVTLGADANLLTLGASGIDMSGATQNLYLNPLTTTVSGSQTWNVATGRYLRLGNGNLDGQLSGSGTITIAGGGLIDLNPTATGATNFTGKWVIEGGTLRTTRNGPANLGASTAADAVTLKGGTLAIGGFTGSGAQGNWTFASPITLAADTTSIIDNQIPVTTTKNRTLTLNGVISGSGNVTFRNPGAAEDVGFNYIVGAANTYTGTTRITASATPAATTGGVLRASLGTAAGAKSPFGTGTVIADPSTSLRFLAGSTSNAMSIANNIELNSASLLSEDGVITYNGTITLSGTNTINGVYDNKNAIFNGVVKDGTTPGAISKTNAATLFLNAANTYTGGTVALGGEITVTHPQGLSTGMVTADGGRYFFEPASAGATMTVSTLRTRNDIHLNKGAKLDITTGDLLLRQTGGFWIQNSSGTVGSITSSSGKLNLNSVDANWAVTTGNLGTSDHQLQGFLVDFDANTPLAVTKRGTNQLALTRANTFTGGLTIEGGRINGANLGGLGTGTVTVKDGGQAYLYATGGSYANNFVLNGLGIVETINTLPHALGALRLGGSTVSGNVEIASASRITAYSSTGTISGALTGAADVEINSAAGGGTLNFTGNTGGYSGTMTLTQGVLNVGTSGLGGNLAVTAGTATVAGPITGNATIAAGTLNLGGNVAGNVTVGDGASLSGEGAVTGSLSLGAATGSTLRVLAGTEGALTVGSLSLAGTTTVALDSLPLADGPFVVLDYTTLTVGDETNLALPANTYRGNPLVVHDIDNTRFTVELDSQVRTWNASATTDWNTTDTNWNEGENLFFSGDQVVFGDNGAGAVSLVGSINPLSVKFQNTAGNNYTLQGAGSLIGATGISMTGGGNLTIGGTGVHTYTGQVKVDAGVLTLLNATGLGKTSGVSVAAGARVDLSGTSVGNNTNTTWTIAGDGGDGEGNLGAITNTLADVYSLSSVANLNLSGNAEIGGNNGRFDIGRNAATAAPGAINGGGFTLTKVGTNSVGLRGAATDINYVINAGSAWIEDTDAASGANPIAVNGTASFGSYGVRTIANAVNFADGTTLANLGGGNGTWTGALTFGGVININTLANTILDGSITGTGNIVRAGGSVLSLQADASAFSGKILNNAGTLRVENNAALGTATGADVITMASGTALQGGTIAGLASATIGSETQGITHTGTATVQYDAGAGNTLTIAGPVTGGTSNVLVTGGVVAFTNSLTATDPVQGILRARAGGTIAFSQGSNATVRYIRLGENGQAPNVANMTIADGALVNTENLITTDGGSYSSVITQSGGTFNITGTNNTNSTSASFTLGHWGGSASYELSGGTLNSKGAVLSLGWDSAGGVNFNQSGGTANLLGINLGNGRGNAAAYNLTGGRLNLGANGITDQASKSINLGGGTVGAAANWASAKGITLTGTNGDTVFDTVDSVDGATPRTIALNGAVAGAGGLVKKGAGILSLANAAGTFTGTAKVEGGSLYLNTGAASAATAKAVAGGTLQPGTIAVPTAATVANLDLDGGTAAFRVGATSDSFNVTNALTVTSASAIQVAPSGALTGPFPQSFTVIDYQGTIGGLGFDGLSFSSVNPHLSGSLVHDTENTQIKAQISAADSVVWKGGISNVWDVNTTANWVLGSDGTTASKYYDFDVVNFDDNGLTQPVVSLQGTIAPSTVKVANTSGSYTFEGSPISGPASLVKEGAGDLVLLNENSFGGTVTVNDGAVIVGNGGTTGTLGGVGNITLNGPTATLVLNRSDAQTLSRTVIGGGLLVKEGANTLTLATTGNVADIEVNGGTLYTRAGGWTAGVAAGRTITLNGNSVLDTGVHSLAGIGAGGILPANLIFNEGSTWVLNGEQYLPGGAGMTKLTAATIAGPNEIRGNGSKLVVMPHDTKSSVVSARVSHVYGITYDVADGAVEADLLVSGDMTNTASATKIGDGKMVLSGANNTWTGGLAVNGGTVEAASVADAGGAASIGTGYLAIANNGTFRYTGTAEQSTARALWMDQGAQVRTVEVVDAAGSLVFTSTAGAVNKPFRKTGAGSLSIADDVDGDAAVTVEAGKLTLSGVNTYTGETSVTGGTLVANGTAIGDASTLTITNGKVEVTGTEVVDKLVIDGQGLAAGTYGATGSGATNIDDVHFAGTGVVQVTTSPQAGFGAWINTFGLAVGDQDPTDDPDGDGLANALEFVLGGNPAGANDLGKLPQASVANGKLVFSFKRSQASKVAGVSVAIETATDLATWPGVYSVGNDTAGSANGVTVTDNQDGTDTVTLTVDQAPDKAKFGRLKVSIN